MSNYEKMMAETKKNYANRVDAMVRSGKTVAEAKAILKAENDRRFAASAARAKCGVTNRPSTIGEILAAKAR